MLKTMRKFPLFRLVALGQLALLTHRHLSVLTPDERRRLIALARRPHKLTRGERKELRRIAAKLEPGAFAKNAARTVSPIGGGPKKPKR